MDKLRKILFHSPLAYFVGLFAFFNPFLFYLSTDFHASFATAVPGIDIAIRVLHALAAAIVLPMLVAVNYKKSDKLENCTPVVIGYLAAAIVSCLLTIANIVILIVLSSSIPMARFYFEKEAPYLLGFGAALSLVFVIPRLRSKTMVAIVASVYLLCGLGLVAVDLWHIDRFDFYTQPVVFDTGKDYSIVWSTTDVSSGYVTYTYAGQDYEVTDSVYGRLYGNRTIHHANVPYEHLNGNTYTVHATRMLDQAPYLAKTGRTVTTSRTFKGAPTGDIYMVAVTDNHCLSKSKFGAVKQDDYNCVLMLGDFADFVHQELDISDFLLYPAYYLSGGEVPVLYAKGNHESHCEMGSELAYLLGFDDLYYRVQYGQYTFTVLDSGGCNPDRDQVKYGGLARYVKYREKQLDWLETMTPSAGYDIVVTHVWDFVSATFKESPLDDATLPDLARYVAALHTMGVDLQLSGHQHDLKFFPTGVDGVDVPILRCGGISAGLVNHDLTYTTLRLAGGHVEMTGYNTKKGKVWENAFDMG